MNKEYVLTQHAQDVIKERGINVLWLEQVLLSPERCEPDPTDPDLEHRLGRIFEYGNRVLRVVASRQAKPVRIVTAYFDRRIKEML